MINPIVRFFIIVLLAVPLNTLLSQHSKKLLHLEEQILKAVDTFSVPGLAVGIVKNGEVVFAKGFGVRSTENNTPVDIETIFGIASLSKAFTAAAIGMLVDEGKIDWNDRVVDHLPWFKLYDPYITREVRIADLLSHRVGLATFDGDLLWYGTDYTRDEIVRRISALPLKNSFRYKYGYQNIMFIVAGEVIEKITGKSWEEFVQTRIFDPLEMNNSSLTNSGFNDSQNIARPHLEGRVQGFISYDNSGPAASINSSVADMLKWAKFWLNKGRIDTNQILSERSYYTITKSYTPMNAGKGENVGGTHFSSTGLGWFLKDYAGRKIISHGGGLPGFLSRIAIVPEDSLGIIILQNDMQPVYRDVERMILDLFLTDKNVDYISRSLDRKKIYKSRSDKRQKERAESRVEDTQPSYSQEKYVGVYEDKMYGKAEISINDGKMNISLLPTKKLFTSEMTHWHFDTFRIKFNDPFLPEGFVTFHKDSRGEITHFTIDLPNPDLHFYNLKFKKQ
jgi:CubicO group peptidase (beta-lactamase class C family)